MGQYYYVCNITKKEFLHPHKFGEGLKLTEFVFGSMGTMSGLALLLADGNGRGGGDIDEDPVSEIVGRWKGNRIVIAGDYADEGRFVKQKDVEGIVNEDGSPVRRKKINLHHLAEETYEDISYNTLFALLSDNDVRRELKGIEGGIIEDFKKIHEQLAKNRLDLPLLIGQLKTQEGKGILEKFLKGNLRQVVQPLLKFEKFLKATPKEI